MGLSRDKAPPDIRGQQWVTLQGGGKGSPAMKALEHGLATVGVALVSVCAIAIGADGAASLAAC
jgi:hypothetical protein